MTLLPILGLVLKVAVLHKRNRLTKCASGSLIIEILCRPYSKLWQAVAEGKHFGQACIRDICTVVLEWPGREVILDGEVHFVDSRNVI
jgi:hypothetical protein